MSEQVNPDEVTVPEEVTVFGDDDKDDAVDTEDEKEGEDGE